jgi:hypothetical protein
VLVQHDEAGDDALPGRVDDSRALGNRHVRADRRNEPVANDERLIRPGRRAGPVDHSHMSQRDHGRIDFDELPDTRRDLKPLRAGKSADSQEKSKQEEGGTTHGPNCSW